MGWFLQRKITLFPRDNDKLTLPGRSRGQKVPNCKKKKRDAVTSYSEFYVANIVSLIIVLSST